MTNDDRSDGARPDDPGDLDALNDVIKRSLGDSARGVGEGSTDELVTQLTIRLARTDAHGPPTAERDINGPDDPRPSRRNTRRLLAVAAAIVTVVAVLGTYVLVTRGNDPTVTNTATDPQSGIGFDAWPPGWHALDRGPVPGFISASLAWFDGRLVVAGGLWVRDGADSGSSNWVTSQWLYDPDERSWSELAVPPFEINSMVVSDGVLVAVGFSTEQNSLRRADREYRWATLTGIDRRWVDHGAINGLFGTDMRPYARTSLEGANILVDTGEMVIDFTLGSVLDPARGRSTALGPSNLAGIPPNSYLPPLVAPVPLRLSQTSASSVVWAPVPTGEGNGAEVDRTPTVFADDMLIWDATGNRLERVSVEMADAVGSGTTASGAEGSDGSGSGAGPTPTQRSRPEDSALRSDRWSTAAVDGRVLVIGVEGAALESAYSIDPASGRAEAITSIGAMIGSTSATGHGPCYFARAAADGGVLATPCAIDGSGAVPLFLRDGDWSAMDPLPAEVAEAARVNTWLMIEPAGDAMVIWSTMDRPERADTLYVPEASRPWAVVWVPGPDHGDRLVDRVTTRSTARASTSAGTAPVADPESCTIDDLPDISFALDDRFTAQPRFGVGGLGDDQRSNNAVSGTNTVCSRYWIAADDPGVHVTQYVGGPPGVAPSSGEPFGPFHVYSIHEGFVIEHRSTPALVDWSLVAYGLGREEVEAVAANLESG